MTTDHLQLPASFVQAVSQHICWQPKDGADSYGNRWPGVLQLSRNARCLELSADELRKWFPLKAQQFAHGSDFWSLDPGFIPSITDFSNILQFGSERSVSPVCFDFRFDPSQPSIIHWTGVYWRRIAASFEIFIDQFEPLRLGTGAVMPLDWWTRDAAADVILLSLSESCRYEVWGDSSRVLVHVVYSATGEPTVVVLPVPRIIGGAVELPPDWSITVMTPSTSVNKPQVVARGMLKELEAGSPKAMAGQAVLALVKNTVWLSGSVATPVIFEVMETRQRNRELSYLVTQTHVPDGDVLDAAARFFVSDDMRVRRF